jgi:hypothetical protein
LQDPIKVENAIAVYRAMVSRVLRIGFALSSKKPLANRSLARGQKICEPNRPFLAMVLRLSNLRGMK